MKPHQKGGIGWVGKETSKDQHAASPQNVQSSHSQMGWPVHPNPKEAKSQNNIKFKDSFVHKLFKLSLALTDTKHNEMEVLETAASDPEKGDEMSFIWPNKWQNIIFSSFFQGGRRVSQWSPQHKGHMTILWVVGNRVDMGLEFGFRQRSHHLNFLVTCDEKK